MANGKDENRTPMSPFLPLPPQETQATPAGVQLHLQEEAAEPSKIGKAGLSDPGMRTSHAIASVVNESAPPVKLNMMERASQAATFAANKAKTVVGKFGLLGRRKERKSLCVYEERLYNSKHHDHGNGLLQAHKIVNQSVEDAKDGLARCINSWRCWFGAVAMLMSVLVGSCTAPCTFMFNGSFDTFDRVPGGWRLVVTDLAMDFVYGWYLAFKLNMTLLHPVRNVEIVQRDEVRKFLLHSCGYWASVLSCTTYLWAAMGCGLWINAFKLVRLVHTVDLPDPLWQIRDNLKLRMFLYMVLLFLGSHWVACLLCAVGGYRERWEADNTWGRIYYDHELVDPLFALYFEAFIEAVYMLTGALDNPKGDGSIRELNLGAMCIVIVMGPIGCIVVALFVSSVCRIVELSSALEIRQAENLAFINRALENLDVPPGLRKRVMSMHQFQKMNHDNEAFDVLFSPNTLSKPLECALRVYLYSESVLFSPFFHGREDDYILEVVKALEDEVFVPGDYLARRGELATAMYFVGSGNLSVLVVANEQHTLAQDAIKVKELGRGEYFGEVALLKKCLRTAWVRADTYVVSQVLTRLALEPIWMFFPEERELLAARVADTVKRDRELQVKNKWKVAEKQVVGLVNGVKHGRDSVHARWPSMMHATENQASPDGDYISEGLASRHDMDEEPFSYVRSPEDVAALQRLTRLCSEMLDQQAELQGDLAELGERQVALEHEVCGEDACFSEAASEAVETKSPGGIQSDSEAPPIQTDEDPSRRLLAKE